MSLIPVEIGPFIGGVNLVDPETKLLSNELRVCLNARRGPRGNLIKRPGHDYIGSTPAKVNGDNLVNFAWRYYHGGIKELLAAAGGKLRKADDVLGTWTNISIDGSGASMHSSNLCDAVVYKDRIYITDGTRVQRYNGTDDIYAGHFIHAAPTTAEAVGGSLELGKTYKYFVTSVTNNMGEGPAGAIATRTLTGANNQINLSSMAAAAAKYEEVTKRIYRTLGNGATYYLLTEIPSATTIFNDTIADSALSTPYVPTHRPPDDSRFVLIGHDERAYWFGRGGANASLVDVSDVGFPDRIRDADGFFSVANNDGDVLTGGGVTPGGLVFLKRKSMWLQRAFGFGLINITPKDKRAPGLGTVSPFSVVYTPIGLIFLSQRGEVYLFDGTNVQEIGYNIASEFRNMSQNTMERIVACYHDYRYQISYDYRNMKGYNWRTLEYDTLTGKWEGPHEDGDLYNPSYYGVYDSSLDRGELVWGEGKAATGSYVYIRKEFSKTDRGTKFISTGRTGRLKMADLAEVLTHKAFIEGEFSGDATVSITHIDDIGTKEKINLNVPSDAAAGKYGTSKYGQAKYGSKKSTVVEGNFESPRARLPAFEISDGGTAIDASFNNIEVLVNPLQLK